MSKEDQKLAKILKDAREKAGLTQAEVAEKAGIHFNYYARVERGEVTPRVDIVENIAKALKISLRFPL
ncbi:MAG: helix-turn-helix transcriptional regulator [Patescibacteria group bacterium]